MTVGITNSKFVVLVIFLTTVVGSIGVYTDISNKNQRELELSNKTKSGNSDFETIFETMSPITDRMEHKTELLEDKIQKYYDELKDELNRQRVLIESIQKNTSILQDDSQNPTVGNTDSSPRVDRAHSIGTIGRPRRALLEANFQHRERPSSDRAQLPGWRFRKATCSGPRNRESWNPADGSASSSRADRPGRWIWCSSP